MRKILCLLSIISIFSHNFAFYETNNYVRPVVIIDPGHGGTDGGATGLQNISEKHFNLSTAMKLYDLMLLSGYDAKLTRNSDDDTDGEAGFNKKKDILTRENLGKEYPDAVFLSIHMNSSTSSMDKGFQVFYGSKNPESVSLAEFIHKEMSACNLATRMRELKAAPNTVYLMKNLPNPCVLIECGFIKNNEDFSLLSDEKYRQKLALVILSATNKYLSDLNE